MAACCWAHQPMPLTWSFPGRSLQWASLTCLPLRLRSAWARHVFNLLWPAPRARLARCPTTSSVSVILQGKQRQAAAANFATVRSARDSFVSVKTHLRAFLTETLDACLSGPNACESTSTPCVVTSGVCGTGPAAFQSGSGQLVELGASMKYFCPSTLPLNSMPNGVRLALFQRSRSSQFNSPGWDAVLHRLCGAFPSPSRQSACSLPYRAASMGQMRAEIRAQDSMMPETVRCQLRCA